MAAHPSRTVRRLERRLQSILNQWTDTKYRVVLLPIDSDSALAETKPVVETKNTPSASMEVSQPPNVDKLLAKQLRRKEARRLRNQRRKELREKTKDLQAKVAVKPTKASTTSMVAPIPPSYTEPDEEHVQEVILGLQMSSSEVLAQGQTRSNARYCDMWVLDYLLTPPIIPNPDRYVNGTVFRCCYEQYGRDDRVIEAYLMFRASRLRRHTDGEAGLLPPPALVKSIKARGKVPRKTNLNPVAPQSSEKTEDDEQVWLNQVDERERQKSSSNSTPHPLLKLFKSTKHK